MKADLSIVTGRHNFKVGTQMMQTRLHEQFGFGITDSQPDQRIPGLPNGNFLAADSIPYDLTQPRRQAVPIRQSANINQYAFYRSGHHQVR